MPVSADTDVLVAIRTLPPNKVEAIIAWCLYLGLTAGQQTALKNVLNEEPTVHLK